MSENWPLLFRGFLIGLSIAAPVGPIGVLCIRRTLSLGRLAGFLTGMGAATADMVYGACAAFGLTVITDLLISNARWLRIIGGCFLLYLGLKTFFEKPTSNAAQIIQNGYFGMYSSTFFLTLTNPLTILSFAAIFAGTLPIGTASSPILLVSGVFLGSTCWWLTLSFGVSAMRGSLTTNLMRWINRISGTVIILFGLAALISSF